MGAGKPSDIMVSTISWLLLSSIFIVLAEGEPYVSENPRQLFAGGSHLARTETLYRSWKTMYNLTLQSTEPPLDIISPSGPHQIPLAPHLEDCASVTRARKAMELFGPEGQLPAWTGDPEGGGPQPPWIRGADADNLAKTRVVQRDIWKHQFPLNCSVPGTRFFLANFFKPQSHGLGSQLHILSSSLSLAMIHNRILVPTPGTFQRAFHEGCTGESYGSLNCYFFPVTSRECEEVAMRKVALQEAKRKRINYRSKTVWSSTLPVIRMAMWQVGAKNWHAAKMWGTPWRDRPITSEVLGRLRMSDRDLMVQWWRSQAIRFILRWPSAHLCHVVNIKRHQVYGMQVALHVATAEYEQRHALEHSDDTYFPYEAKTLRKVELDSSSNFDSNLWRTFGEEPYIMRPIVSMHVRQGDKSVEMTLYSLAAHVWLANRLRLHVPTVHHIWLSTEMQSVVDETADYPDWKFWYTRLPRQIGNASMPDYEQQVGLRELSSQSFANLLISSQCDYFVGALGSNWNRLINELRLTNGRLHAGYLAVNYDDW